MKSIPENIYFVGAGGIGMANLVRYYLSKKANVAGYDRTPSALTAALEHEGASLTFTDSENEITETFRNPETTLVVYTPAVPESNRILTFFRQSGHKVIKRAALLGEITRQSQGICVAGSHGKTTTSSMIAHILNGSAVGCNAFLGGILRNCNSNLILSDHSPYSVIEADEYDRSFHHLSPFISIVTSTDPDHLDIYGDEEGYLEGFAHYTSLTRAGGYLLLHSGLKLHHRAPQGVTVLSYGAKEGDFHAEGIKYLDGRLYFSITGPSWRIDDVELGQPIEINIDNAVAAAAAAHIAGASDKDIREALRTFLGAKRRFEFWVREEGPDGKVMIDDYAHSPGEIAASISSIRKLYPGRRLTVIFQPHLYTRTRDFAPEFSEALSQADEVILLEIYPARELPIPGVTSEIIYDKVTSAKKSLCLRKNLPDFIKNSNFDILMTLGAADIDVILPQIKEEYCAQKR